MGLAHLHAVQHTRRLRLEPALQCSYKSAHRHRGKQLQFLVRAGGGYSHQPRQRAELDPDDDGAGCQLWGCGLDGHSPSCGNSLPDNVVVQLDHCKMPCGGRLRLAAGAHTATDQCADATRHRWCVQLCRMVVQAVRFEVQTEAAPSQTRVGFFSYDAPVVTIFGLDNHPATGGASVTVAGFNFGIQSLSVELAIGQTLCTKTTWSTGTSVVCAPAAGIGSAQRLSWRISSPLLAFTASAAYTYDAPVLSSVSPRPNATDSEMQVVTLAGLNFGASDLTATAGLFGKACRSVAWVPDSHHLLCNWAGGMNANRPFTTFHGEVVVESQHAVQSIPCDYSDERQVPRFESLENDEQKRFTDFYSRLLCVEGLVFSGAVPKVEFSIRKSDLESLFRTDDNNRRGPWLMPFAEANSDAFQQLTTTPTSAPDGSQRRAASYYNNEPIALTYFSEASAFGTASVAARISYSIQGLGRLGPCAQPSESQSQDPADGQASLLRPSPCMVDAARFWIDILPRNDAPYFALKQGETITLLENKNSSQSVTLIEAFVGEMSVALPSLRVAQVNEAAQTLRFEVNVSNPSLFDNSHVPTVSTITGDLNFTLAPHKNGEAVLVITLWDSGGVANGGNNQLSRNVTLRVLGMNTPPSFQVEESFGSQMVSDAAADVAAEL